MADQNDTQSPSQPVPAPQTPAAGIVEETFSSAVKALWAKYGIFFILIGIGILALKFGNLLMDILGWSSKKDLEQAQKTDTQLKAKEDATNAQANALVKEANDLPKTEGKVDDDWDKK